MTEAESKSTAADRIVKKNMLISAGVGIIPLPLLDLVVLTAMQLKMLQSLSKLYDVEFSKNLGKSAIASLVGGGAAVTLPRLLVPGLGAVASAVGVALFSGASTYAIGKVFIQDFESGGTFLTFNPQRVKDYYAREFENGKKEIVVGFAGVKP